MNRPLNYHEKIIHMHRSRMNSEIVALFLEGVEMSVTDGKIGMVSGNFRRIYDFEHDKVILRIQDISEIRKIVHFQKS